MTTQTQNTDVPPVHDADATIDACLDVAKPMSFFLFAGAGSGKTRSLVRALEELRKRSGEELRLHGRQIAVITYTNAACDEITRRLQFDPLIAVSTIHSFVWEQIRGFDRDIRAWLKANTAQEIAELEAEQAKGKKASQASADRAEKIKSLNERRSTLDSIRKFIYSPTGDNRTKDSLSHGEVIKIGADFLQTKPLMQRLLVSRYPVLLIDESQDTNKALIDAFFAVEAAHPDTFCMGLFGDIMQRIYADGKVDLGRSLPETWKRPAKLVNHRSPKRVITLINKIRSKVDDHQQQPQPNAKDGVVRFFIAKGEGADRAQCEAAVRQRMAALSGDARWNEPGGVKALTLEHHMAAQRLGFTDIFGALDAVREFGTGLRDGSLPLVALFTKLVLPLVTARLKGDKFAVAAIVRDNSPLLSIEALTGPEANQAGQLKAARDAVEDLAALFANKQQPTLHQVLASVASTQLFRVPPSLHPFAAGAAVGSVDGDSEQPDDDMSGTKILEAIRKFLAAPFAQIAPYAEYVKGESGLATHQGVKGLEFPRVLVVMDDAEARGFMFNFEKLFGAEAPTTTDLKNEREGKETGIDRTRRLFYVTCSRAQEGLALVAYTADPLAVKKTLIEQGWFAEAEIEMM
jgi:DNA helicase-2/ATP-dependent DNA helicase PcrA